DLDDGRTLHLITALRKTLPAEQASAVLELARLRHKAVAKFGTDAARLFFTRDALEQASDAPVRRYHALEGAGQHVADLCCGIGADALAFAAAGAQVLAVDLDPLRAEITRLNAAAFGLPVVVQTADVRGLDPEADFVFCDPARREDGRRIFSVEACHPPLSTIRRWRAPRIRVKLSPGVDVAELNGYGGEVAFVSVAGDLKEALLKTSRTQFGPDPIRRAVLIANESVQHWPDDDREPGAIGQPRAWLIEPDAALIRAGLVTSAGRAWNAVQLDEQIAYLTADTPPATSWARSWRVLEWLPFNLKALRAALRARSIGHAAVKRRGSPITPEALLPQLKLKGAAGATIVLTRLQNRPIALICGEHPAIPPTT
ncbi:MAG: methyltransferase domain-containing protein, partial [Anaerolineae bacterium]|nr:methyltransferase domain-containing protein [Anaerolineae bacterium]